MPGADSLRDTMTALSFAKGTFSNYQGAKADADVSWPKKTQTTSSAPFLKLQLIPLTI